LLNVTRQGRALPSNTACRFTLGGRRHVSHYEMVNGGNGSKAVRRDRLRGEHARTRAPRHRRPVCPVPARQPRPSAAPSHAHSVGVPLRREHHCVQHIALARPRWAWPAPADPSARACARPGCRPPSEFVCSLRYLPPSSRSTSSPVSPFGRGGRFALCFAIRPSRTFLRTSTAGSRLNPIQANRSYARAILLPCKLERRQHRPGAECAHVYTCMHLRIPVTKETSHP
jgi:hypothetical protein